MGSSLKTQRQPDILDQRVESASHNAGRSIRLLHAGDPKLDALLQVEIGRTLRSYYAELLNEPVPQRFTELLVRLDRKH